MANTQRGEVDILIEDKKYTMRPTFEAMCEIEDRLDLSMPELVMHLQNGELKFKTIATIIWCGIHGYSDSLYTKDAAPTLSELGNAIRTHGITKLISEGLEIGENPVVNFVTRGLIGDEAAEENSKKAKAVKKPATRARMTMKNP